MMKHPAARTGTSTRTRRWLATATLVVVVVVFAPETAISEETPSQAATGPEVLTRIDEAFVGDLSEIIDRGVLRVLVSYSRTNYFVDFGTERGFEYELVRQYEKYLNEGRPLGHGVIIAFIPVPLEKLLSELEAGRGDVAVGGLTITDARSRRVAFSEPYIPNVREVVVANQATEVPDTIEGLAGREILVRSGSSYLEHIIRLNRRLEEAGKEQVQFSKAPAHLVTEDLLELVNAGVFELTVADQHIAEAWAGVLPGIRVHNELVINSGGAIGWAIRRESPELEKSLNGFFKTVRKGTLLGNVFFKRYFTDSTWISNPMAEADDRRLEELRTVFVKYGEQYGFDWIALAAVGYQESRLRQDRRSRAGAVGVMQLKPSTAADRNVGITPIDTVDNNIHAATKYLAFLRDRYFTDPAIPDEARFDFTIAAYNAGPARIARLRREAAEKGYNPNLWFFNVEAVAAARIGAETVKYVANVNKYYLAYSSSHREGIARDREMDALGSMAVD